jgi:hypothetical protein
MGRGKASKRRLIENFDDFSIPMPWDDFEYIMTKHFKFEMDENTGSNARSFTRENETFTAYKPHGRKRIEKNVHISDRKKARDALRRLGLLSEE